MNRNNELDGISAGEGNRADHKLGEVDLPSFHSLWNGSSYLSRGKRIYASEYDESKKYYYTEDNLIVNTVYANFKKFPGVISESSMRQLFENFGSVKRIQIYTNQYNEYNARFPKIQKGTVFSFAFISFEECEDAAK